MEIAEKDQLVEWRIECNEQLNHVWLFKMIHKTGATIEKTGTDLSELLRETRIDAFEMNKQLRME